MLFTWGAIVLLIFYGALEVSVVDFSAILWVIVAVTALMSVAADVARNRRPILIEVQLDEPAVYTHR